MTRPTAALLALALLAPASAPASARTWRVEKVLTADFRSIQPALDAASPGDTILIGYGRWTEKQTVTLPNWPWAIDVYAWVHDSNLTIIGTGPANTVIGPLTPPSFSNFGPKGFVVYGDLSGVTIQDLAVENTYDGVYAAAGQMVINQCRFNGTYDGVYYDGISGLNVVNSAFTEMPGGQGVLCLGARGAISISGCSFSNVCGGVNVGSSGVVAISNCIFQGGVVAIQYYDGSAGSVTACTINDSENYGVVVKTGSQVSLDGNQIHGGGASIAVLDVASITGHANELTGASWSTLWISNASLVFHGNHIINGGAYSVRLDNFLASPNVNIDLSNNYWGTTSAAQISQWILDGQDNPNVHAVVVFAPFAEAPVGTENRSWGEVKQLYGR